MSKAEKIKVLYIDDEFNNLVGFKATFRLDYIVLIANSAASGIEMLSLHPDIKVILCDQRMPDKTGVQFFEEIIHLYPIPLRMLLTGYSDLESVIQAINKGHVFRYIPKPWNEKEIRDAIEEGCKYMVEKLNETEIQLVVSEKMSALSQLTAGLAHEINNSINFVTSNFYPLKRDVDVLHKMIGQILEIVSKDFDKERQKNEIEQLIQDHDYDYLKNEIGVLLKGIRHGSSRTAKIIKGLKSFSSIDNDEIKKANINEGLIRTTTIATHLLNDRINIKKKYAEIPDVECFPGKLNQAFLNILTNAIQSIHKRWGENLGGEIKLKTWADKEQVYISINDNGTGMDSNTQKRLFEPFFTTKEVGKGTGLGLSIAYNIIKKHRGSIELTTVLGEGTEFIITIPIFHNKE